MSGRAYVQWHNSEGVCMDFECPKCATSHHLDGPFSGVVRCAGCKQAFAISGLVDVRDATPEQAGYATQLEADEEDQ